MSNLTLAVISVVIFPGLPALALWVYAILCDKRLRRVKIRASINATQTTGG